jgi:hypothetical protein
MLKFPIVERQEINLVFKIKVFVGSKIWYFNKFYLFIFSKNLGCYTIKIGPNLGTQSEAVLCVDPRIIVVQKEARVADGRMCARVWRYRKLRSGLRSSCLC